MKILIAILFLLMLVNSAHAQWQQITPSWGYRNIRCFHEKNGAIYAGTESDGFFISKDKGITWEQRNKGLSDFGIMSITSNNNNLYAAVYQNGVFFSENEGVEWKHLPSILDAMVIISIKFSNDVLYAATIYNGVFASTNYGKTWVSKNNGLAVEGIIAMDVSDSVIAVGSPNYVFISTNGGDTWQRKLELPNKDVNDLKIVDNKTIAILSNVMYVTHNLGINWNVTATGVKYSTVIHSMYVDNKGIVYFGRDGDIMISKDKGDTWIGRGVGNNQPIMSLCVVDSSILASDVLWNLHISKNMGKSWTNVAKVPIFRDNVFFTKKKAFIVSNNQLYVSENNGSDWQLALDLPNVRITDKVLHAEDTIIFGSGYDIVYSSNAGSNWTFFNTENNPNRPLALVKDHIIIVSGNESKKITLKDSSLSAVSLAPQMINANSIYRYDSVLLCIYNGTYISYDNGKKWTYVPGLSELQPYDFFRVAVKDSVTFIVTYKGTYYTHGNLNEWKTLKIDADTVFNDIVVHKENLYILGSRNNIYVSSDNGNTWQVFDNTGLPEKVDKLYSNTVDMYAGTGSLYRYHIPQTQSISPYTNEVIILYPNPAENEITVYFTDDFNPVGRFSIINVLGHEVFSGIFSTVVDSFTIPLNSFTIGIYTFVADFENGRKAQMKFIVSR